MNQSQLVSHVAKQEGKKHQASIGDIREIVSIIGEVLYKEFMSLRSDTSNDLIAAAANRAKRRAKRRKK